MVGNKLFLLGILLELNGGIHHDPLQIVIGLIVAFKGLKLLIV